jgi:hypothetical protein
MPGHIHVPLPAQSTWTGALTQIHPLVSERADLEQIQKQQESRAITARMMVKDK